MGREKRVGFFALPFPRHSTLSVEPSPGRIPPGMLPSFPLGLLGWSVPAGPWVSPMAGSFVYSLSPWPPGRGTSARAGGPGRGSFVAGEVSMGKVNMENTPGVSTLSPQTDKRLQGRVIPAGLAPVALPARVPGY